ncbi:fimbrillin family protein [Bacteroides intestinalis]|uniref:fimbrillin family protein n=1 Tax=Bacteroides intestinalis TaxID=329854 RepID=UPI0005CACCA7|nr:fimbrillin family protein [Bacteroides intestinalis]
MKRIYNKVYHAAMAALMLTAATACTSDNEPLQNDDTPQTTPLTTVTATQQGADTQTRTNYSDGNETIGVTWAGNDKIYIGPAIEHTTQGGVDATITDGLPTTYKTYTIESGQNSKNATFKVAGEALEVPSGTQYIYAFYGDKSKMEHDTDGCVSFALTGQRQTKNSDMTHIAPYDFMYAKAEYQAGQTPNFDFQHVASLLKFDLTLPSNGITVKQLELKTNAGKYIVVLNTKGSYNFNSSGSFSSATAITLKLGEGENGFTCDTKKLTAYMMAFVYKSSSYTLDITVTDSDNKTYSANIGNPNDSEAGKFYTITATLTEDTN